MGSAPDIEEEEENNFENHDDDGSSEEMFGFATSAPKSSKAVPKRRASKGPENGTTPASHAAVKPPLGVNSKGEDSTTSNRISKANENMTFLEKLSEVAVWQGSVKEKDLQTKLEKCFKLSEQIAECSDAEAQDASKALYDKAAEVATWHETLITLTETLSESSIGEAALQLTAQNYSVLRMLPADCLNAILTDFGRKLTEAGSFPAPFFRRLSFTF